MVYRINFEAEIQGLSSLKKVTGDFLVYGESVLEAKQFGQTYLSGIYGTSYAIIEVLPMFICNME